MYTVGRLLFLYAITRAANQIDDSILAMSDRGFVFVGIAGESLSNRTTSKLGTGLYRAPVGQLDAWQDLSPRLCELPEVRAITAPPDEPGTLYAGTQLGVHRSTDRGDSWQLLGAPPPRFGVWSVAVPRGAPEVIIAGYDPNEVHVSNDGGRTWTAAAMPASYPPGASHEPKRVMGLAFDPKDRRIVHAVVEAGGALRSEDGGRSFVAAALSDRVDPLDLHAVAVAEAGVIAVGRDGIFCSRDRGRSYAHAVDDSLELAGIAPGELADIVEQVSREQFAGNLCIRSILDVGAGDRRLRVALGARRSSRTDYGEDFDPAALGARRNGEGRERPAACWHATAAVIAACYRRHDRLVVESHLARFDSAAAFHARAGAALSGRCTCNQPGGGGHGDELRAARGWMFVEQYCRSVAVASPDVVYVGAGASWLSEHGTIHRSRDGGRRFEPLALPARLDSTVFGVAVAPTDARRIAAATREGQVLLSTDGGDSWQPGALPGDVNPVYALCVI